MQKTNTLAYLFAGALVMAALAASITIGFSGRADGASFLENPSYNTASSTVYTVGHQASTQILTQRGNRGYARICNTGPRPAYLFFATTTAHALTTRTATTSANTLVPVLSCYDIDGDNRFTGEVHAMQEVASSTASLLVTEFIVQ